VVQFTFYSHQQQPQQGAKPLWQPVQPEVRSSTGPWRRRGALIWLRCRIAAAPCERPDRWWVSYRCHLALQRTVLFGACIATARLQPATPGYRSVSGS
jgi:hypothetical protein